MQKKIVLRTTLMVAAGVTAATGVMLAVYAVLGYFSIGVLIGGLLGAAYAAFNFYMRSIGQVKALAKETTTAAKHATTLSYTLRMFGMLALAVLGFVTKWYDGVAFLLPQVFAQAFTFVYYFIMVKKEARGGPSAAADEDGPGPEQEAEEENG